MKNNDKIIFDTETTGLLEPNGSKISNQPHIMEIYIARLDKKNKIIDELETFLSIPVEVPKHITKLTGIDDSMLVGAPQFIEKYQELIEIFIGARTMIAHNLPFDAGMLWCELSRIDKVFQFPWPPKWYCTVEHSFHLENKRIKLGRLHEHATGSEFKKGAHRAKQDVFALIRCYKWMIENEM